MPAMPIRSFCNSTLTFRLRFWVTFVLIHFVLRSTASPFLPNASIFPHRNDDFRSQRLERALRSEPNSLRHTRRPSRKRVPFFIRRPRVANDLSAYMACYAEKGRWELNTDPRPLPWPIRVKGTPSACDKGRLEGMEISGALANQIALRWQQTGEGKEDWRVPQEVMWEWQVEGCGEVERFNYDKFCSAKSESGSEVRDTKSAGRGRKPSTRSTARSRSRKPELTQGKPTSHVRHVSS
eukprot:TRINITY_DN5096_c0_g1_i1.p1 TRINITY_DN5096_c0_g1~~TRINITY_DN5096_c0_g1_i1.p1  ORF type:complete len:238 (-),score=14.28 TRINITY_DN5096_c0_g1_i1:900-1613(-)